MTDAESGPYGISAGADGALWLTLVHSGEIARMTVDGVVERYPAGSRPTIIAAGVDEALWFTRSGDDHIGRITTGGVMSEFALPSGSGPFGMCAGPDETMWFTEMNTDRIGRITPEGRIVRFELPVRDAFPSMVVCGPDDALWFTLNQANAIGRTDLDGKTTLYPVPGPGAPVGITPNATFPHRHPNHTASPSALTAGCGQRWKPAQSPVSRHSHGNRLLHSPTTTPARHTAQECRLSHFLRGRPHPRGRTVT